MSELRSWIDEGDICGHCGGGGGYDSIDDDELDEFYHYVGRYEFFYRQGRSCSLNGDHSAAIRCYKDALGATYESREKCDMLSAIADEYEAIGDYSSAEEYWMRCCEVERYGRIGDVYKYIADKGGFLYRRDRFGEAINAYDEALKELDFLKDRYIGLDALKYYARIVHYLLDSYFQLAKDVPSKKYHDGFKCAIGKFIRSSRIDNETKAYYLSKAAWELFFDEALTDEALILIDSAIEIHPNPPGNDYNRKAIMLERKLQFEEALKYYDRALSKDRFDKTFLNNKAGCIREDLKNKLLFNRIEPHDLDMINKALEILPEGYDNSPYLFIKAQILIELGDPVKARVCNALAAKRYGEVDKADWQLKKLKSSQTYINITGIQHYRNFAPFKEGTVVDLIKEPDNPHDRDAIRVEIMGETVGYVANSKYTLIKEVKSATDIKNTVSAHAEVQFILFDEWVIAKLIERR